MSQSHVHSKKVNSDALGHTKSTTGDVGLSDILLGSQEDEFLVPEGEGVLKVLISGMGSTASLAAVDVDDDDSLCPRVNTRNCTSTPISQPSVGSCVGGKLNLLSSGILGVSLGASQGPVPLSVCSLKNGCASIEDLSSLSPLLPRQLFLSEEDSEKEQLEGLSASSPDSVVSCSEIDKSGDGQYIEILHSENVSVPDGTLRSHEMDAEKQKHEGLNDSSAQGQASRLPSMVISLNVSAKYVFIH